MIVDVDIGNTRLKWRVRGTAVVDAVPLDSWSTVIEQWLERRVDKIIVSCVAGVRLRADFVLACVARLNVRPEFACVQDGLRGLKLAYRDTDTFGVDRWLAMLAALHRQHGKNLIVVSAGSAFTVDYVRFDGTHLGGVITPGLAMSSKALGGGAAQIGEYPIDLCENRTMGSSTRDCVVAGLSVMYRGFVAQVVANCPFDVKSYCMVLAGGDSEQVLSMCPQGVAACIEPALVLDGLGLIH